MKINIKTLLVILLLFTFTVLVSMPYVIGQTVKPTRTVQTEQSLTNTATVTPYSYKGSKVFKSSKDKYFTVKKSKSGNYYKIYVTIQ